MADSHRRHFLIRGDDANHMRIGCAQQIAAAQHAAARQLNAGATPVLSKRTRKRVLQRCSRVSVTVSLTVTSSPSPTRAVYLRITVATVAIKTKNSVALTATRRRRAS